MSKDLNIIGLQPTMEIAPTQLTIGATSTANELKLETTYDDLLEDGSTIFTTVGGITTPHVVGTVVKTQGTAPVTTTKTITGNTTTINNSPFNNSTVPTLGNMIIVSNTARAIADNASATTFNFNLSSGNDILELQPSMKILLESIEIDPASTTSSLVLNSPYNNYIVDGTPLILDQAGIVTQVIAGTVVKTATTIPTNVTFTITGATTSLPTLYAFNSTNVTVSNMTIASNVATATANSASATTFEYTASGDVTEAQAIAILQPTELDIDPSSTTGSIKVNYTTNNLLQVGSKVLVTDGGVTTEQTIAAGSQASVGGWTQRTQPSPARTLYCVTYGNGLFVAAGTDGKIVTSPDGITWTNQTSGYSFEFDAITYGNGRYVAVTQDASNSIFTSTDGVTWTKNLTVSLRLWAVAYGGGLFVAAGNDGSLITSSDGLTWTNRISGFTSGQRCTGVAYGNGTWIVVNEHTTNISTSTDGVTWTIKGTSGAITTPVLCVTYGNGVWVIGGNNAEIATSSDTNTWIARTSNLTAGGSSLYSVRAAIFANNRFYITAFSISFSNCISTSPDGITWTGQNAGFASSRFYGLAYGVNKLVAVGDVANQSIMTLNDTTYQFTITSPSLPVPDAMYLGGQVLQSNVGGAGWVTHTVTYSDSSGTITFTGNNRTGLTGDTVQIRMTTINNTEVLSYFRGNLVVETADGYTYTCSAFDTPLTSVPVKAYKGGQTLLSSCTATNTPSLVAVSSYTYTRSGDIITYTGNNRTGLAGLYVQLRAATLNENDILTYFGYTYLSLDPTSGWTYTCTNINPRLTTLPGDVYYGNQQVQTNVDLDGWETHAVSEIVSIAANTFRVAYTSISSEPGKDVQLRVQQLAEEDEVSRMKLTITQD